MATRERQLTRVDIKGFKSLRDSSIDLGTVNVLIGSNGAGKSNFISAFDMLGKILKGGLGLYAAQAGIPSLFYNGLKVTDEIRMNFCFGDYAYGFSLLPTDDHRLVFKEEHFCNDRLNTDMGLGSGHSESRWAVERNDAASIQMRELLRRNNWRVYHFHDTSRNSYVKRQGNVVNNDAFRLDAGNLAAFLYRLRDVFPTAYKNILRAVQSVAPYFDDFVLRPDELNPELIALQWRKKGCEDIFTASQLSDGTLRFICLATLLLQPEALQPETIIIDEPELGLHPFAITILAEMIHATAQSKQLIVATQSVELLNQFDTEDVVVVEGGENGTEFKRLDSDALQIWLDEDYSLGDLWNKNLLGGRV